MTTQFNSVLAEFLYGQGVGYPIKGMPKFAHLAE